jgi:ribosome-associated protein
VATKAAVKPAVKKITKPAAKATVKAKPAVKVAVKAPAKTAAKSKVTAKKPAAKVAAKAAPKAKNINNAELLAKIVVTALDDKKAEDIVTINVVGKCSFADIMIVATGRSARHVATLADDAVEAVRKSGLAQAITEGKEVGDWVLIDAGDVVIHLFRPEVRQYYNLEKMWSAPAAGADL